MLVHLNHVEEDENLGNSNLSLIALLLKKGEDLAIDYLIKEYDDIFR